MMQKRRCSRGHSRSSKSNKFARVHHVSRNDIHVILKWWWLCWSTREPIKFISSRTCSATRYFLPPNYFPGIRVCKAHFHRKRTEFLPFCPLTTTNKFSFPFILVYYMFWDLPNRWLTRRKLLDNCSSKLTVL